VAGDPQARWRWAGRRVWRGAALVSRHPRQKTGMSAAAQALFRLAHMLAHNGAVQNLAQAARNHPAASSRQQAGKTTNLRNGNAGGRRQRRRKAVKSRRRKKRVYMRKQSVREYRYGKSDGVPPQYTAAAGVVNAVRKRNGCRENVRGSQRSGNPAGRRLR